MKITHDSNVGENRNNKTQRALNVGARAVGYAFGGKAGAEAASKIANSKPVQNVANAIQNRKNKKNPQQQPNSNNPQKQNNEPNKKPNENQQANATQQKTKESDVGSENLKKSLANRGRNALMNLRNRRKKKAEADSNSNSSDNSSSNLGSANSETEEEGKENVAKRIKRKIIRTIIMIALPLLGLIFILLVAFSVIATIFPFLIPDMGDEEKVLISDVGTDQYDKESKYYAKLDEIKTKYEKQCNKSFNISFIHSTLIYFYYETDINVADYDKMSDMIDVVVGEIPDVCNVNYTVNGDFYNNLKNNEKFKEYYAELLEDRDMDNILSNIFELGETLDISDDAPSKIYISNGTKVNVNKEGEIIESNTQNNKALTLKEYLVGMVYSQLGSENISDSAKIQALTIASTTTLLSDNRLSVGDQTLTINFTSNNYCSVTDGCSYNSRGDLVNGGGSNSSKNTHFYKGKYYYRIPLESSQITTLNTAVNGAYGRILVNNLGGYSSLNTNDVLNANGSNYQDILKSAYPDLKVSNIIENNYADDLDYGVSKVKTDVIFYEQKDYTSSFCNLKRETIAGSGCGVTAMAIVVSTYENNRKYDPVYMNKQAISRKQCFSGDGTAIAFFGSQARAMGYKYQRVGKKTSEKNLVLKHLSQGHLVVVHVGPGNFTGGGHYMVLGGVDPETKKVYVYDPNNRSNVNYRKTGNGWYSFNTIVKQTKSNGFHIIWKG